MSNQTKPKPDRQQSADIPGQSFGKLRMPAVAAAASVKAKPAKPAEPKRDLPPLLRKDQFLD